MSITLEDIKNLSTEVRSLVDAGLPLESELADAGVGHGKRLQQLTESISEQLSKGESLEAVVRENQLGAPRMLAAAVAAGVRSGRLGETVELLGDLASDLVDLRRRILQSLAYPLTILATALVLFVVFIRRFLREVFYLTEDHGIQSSPAFRAALEFDAAYWWWPVSFLVAGALLVLYWLVSGRAGSMAFRGPERLFFIVPGVRRMVTELRFYSLTRMLTLMIHRELPLWESLELAGACTGNSDLDNACQRLSDEVKKGELPAAQTDRVWQSGEMPPLLMVGLQQTGLNESQFRERLNGISGYYRRRLHSSLLWLKTVVPIAMFLIIGGGTVLVYGMFVFWPVTELYQSLAPN